MLAEPAFCLSLFKWGHIFKDKILKDYIGKLIFNEDKMREIKILKIRLKEKNFNRVKTLTRLWGAPPPT